MSQWGARGAAESGLSWSQILDFYYPSTVRHSIGNGEIRVWLSADTDGNTTVLPARGLQAAVGNTRRVLPTGAGYKAWRAVESRGRVSLQYQDAKGTWRAYSFGSGAATGSGIVSVRMPDGSVKEVRGAVSAMADSTAPGRLRTVLHSTMESYLRGVVPAEMPSSWHSQALAAQSVAARTYAASYQRNQRNKGAVWDICDTVTCQVFRGVATTSKWGTRTSGEHTRTNAAITSTSGTVLRTSAAAAAPFAHTEFSASNGGYTVAGGPRYQVAKRDPYDGKAGNPHTSWTTTLAPATVDAAFGVGAVRSIQVLRRDGLGLHGGRALQVEVTGSRGKVTVSGLQFRMKLKLKSQMIAFVGKSTATAPSTTPRAPAVPRAAAPTKPAPVAPGTGQQRSLLSTDSAGRLFIRDPQGGTYGSPSQIGRSWHTLDQLLSVGDFDGTGTEDVVARQKSTGRLVLYKGRNAGPLRGPRAPLTGPYMISEPVRHLKSITSVGDFDKDGRLDLAAVDNRGRIVLLRGGAGGTIVEQRILGAPVGVTALLAAGQFDKDGNPDIMWVDRSGRAHVGLGNGRNGFRSTTSMGRGWNGFAHVWSPGDMGGDGVDDVLALDRGGTLFRYDGNGRGVLGARSVVSKGLSGVLVGR